MCVIQSTMSSENSRSLWHYCKDDKLNLYVRKCNCVALFSNGRQFVEKISGEKSYFYVLLSSIGIVTTYFINKLVLYL